MHARVLLVGLLLTGLARADEPKGDAAGALSRLDTWHSCFYACYVHEQMKNQSLKGTLSFDFDIGTDGRVASGTVKGVSPEVDACAREFLGRMEFAHAAAPVKVKHEMKFNGLTEGMVGGGGPCACNPCGEKKTVLVASPEFQKVLDRAAAREPRVLLGSPTISDDKVEKATLRRYLKKEEPKLIACHDKAGEGKEVKLELTYTITKSGAVKDASVPQASAALAKCLSDVVSAITHPAQRADVKVRWPIMLRPPPTLK